MSAKNQKAIRSAQTVLVLRAVAAKENNQALRCDDYLAEKFLTGKYRLLVRLLPHRLLKTFIHLKSPGSYYFMITRTKYFDQTLLEEIRAGVQQVVLLGAGYDSRLCRFAYQLKDIPVFEVDFPGTQLCKIRRLEKIYNSVPGEITFIPLDLTKDTFDSMLLRNGFSPRLKTLFLWEGVSYYLPQVAVQQILTFVSGCACGSSIVFDYATRDFVNGDHRAYGGRQISKWLKKIREPFLFGLNAAETSDFLKGCKLSVIADYGPEEMERIYLQNEEGQVQGRTLGHVRMVHARVI